jgi:hypothetical protein
MNRKLLLFINLFAMLALMFSTGGHALAAPSADTIFTGYYTMMGHEGIGIIGDLGGTTHGATPPVGDYVTTSCRYINVANAAYRQYFLRYPLHLPNGVTITKISLFVADFNAAGTMYVHFMSRPWNSRTDADFTGSIGTSAGAAGDQVISRTLTTDVVVNNKTTQYWVDVMPTNSADPGQMCVYSLQVTYTSNGAFLPLINNGG